MEWLEIVSRIGSWAVAGAILLAIVLCRRAPTEGRTVMFFTGLFLLGVFGEIMVRTLGESGLMARALFRYCEGLGLIVLAGVAVFRVMLPTLRISSPRILQDIVVAVVVLFWSLYSLQYFGVHLSSIIATSAVLTAVIGFALQDTLSNAAAGLALQLDRSIRTGDSVQFDGVSGKVVETSWRFTALETANGDTLVVPNALLVRNKFIVTGRRKDGPESHQRRWIWFNVDFGQPPVTVIESVESALKQADIPFVATEPAPSCLHMEFTESYSKYALRYWVTDISMDLPTDSKVRAHLLAALQRAGISMSIPSHSVFLTEETEQRQAMRESRDMEVRLKALRQVEIFGKLPEDELLALARSLVPAPFESGGIIARQGDEATCLYLVKDGVADVLVDTEQSSTKVGEIGPGSFFGEWGLLTGEPRRATVIARSRMHVYELDKEAFEHLLKTRPAVAEEISEILAQRRAATDATLESLDTETRSARLHEICGDILGRIRKFFGLGG